ncbi:PilZ domain-containing protein [Actinotalea ferrariae]|uniref:PilZ domain-containing protein n=1 Tax=Actinotalea ferrariae TaxID=1386098 RepID=UPI00138DF2E9|nr:PilZ domain-containing protein [Actinotalea ferrariae]
MAHDLDRCRVFGVEGELLAEGFVREQEASSLLVEAEHFSGRWLSPGDPVVVEVLSAVQGECTFDAAVTWSEARRIGLAGLRLRERLQKRAAVRVPVELPHRVLERVVGTVREPLEEPLDIVVLDVSAYGLRFRTRAEVETGTHLALTFTATRRPLDLVLEVVRVQELRSDHAYGSRLVDPDERTTDALFTFVLDEQRRQLAERRDSF